MGTGKQACAPQILCFEKKYFSVIEDFPIPLVRINIMVHYQQLTLQLNCGNGI
jgi:hypothetical protein